MKDPLDPPIIGYRVEVRLDPGDVPREVCWIPVGPAGRQAAYAVAVRRMWRLHHDGVHTQAVVAVRG